MTTTKTPKQRPHVLVVGAGMAGLSAAAYLTRDPRCRVTLVEAATIPGGRLATWGQTHLNYKGRAWSFPNEHGLHGVFFQYRNMRRLLEEEGLLDRLRPASGQEFLFPTRGGGVGVVEIGASIQRSPLPDVLALGAFYREPDLLKALVQEGPLRSFRALWTLAHAFAFDDQKDLDRYDRYGVDDLIEGWPEPQRRLTSALTRSGAFAEPEEVSLAGFLMGFRYYAIGDKRCAQFSVFKQDTWTDLIGPVIDGIKGRGGEVILGSAVERLGFEGGQVTSAALAGRSEVMDVDAVVVALDPISAQTLFQASGCEALMEGLVLPKGFPSMAARFWTTMDVAADRSDSGVFGGGEADAFFWLHRLQDPFMRWHEATGGAVLECHLYADRARAADVKSDEVVLGELEAMIQRVWPSLAGHIVHSHLQRNAPTHVALGPGSLAHLPEVQTAVDNVALCGDWIRSGWPMFHLEQATTTGLQAARKVLDALLTSEVKPSPLPAPLPPFPIAPSVQLVGRLARGMRSMGLLPALGRSRGR